MGNGSKLTELLGHWQAFSLLQQRAFAFLAAESVNAGLDFENSTDGAALLLTRIGSLSSKETHDQTNTIVQKLQSADRSRQGLEQVASVLTTLKAQHEELVKNSLTMADMPSVDQMQEIWVKALADNITLSDWRKRLLDALNGVETTYSAPAEDFDDTELF